MFGILAAAATLTLRGVLETIAAAGIATVAARVVNDVYDSVTSKSDDEYGDD